MRHELIGVPKDTVGVRSWREKENVRRERVPEEGSKGCTQGPGPRQSSQVGMEGSDKRW